jgi:ADP-heptose:LPS heptosyltransferase
MGSFLLLDSLCHLLPVRSCDVAVIVRLDAVGDFFIWMQSGAVDIARYARQSGRRTVLLANSSWADYARRLKLWEEVVAVDPKRLMANPLYRLALLGRVRMLGARMLIQPRAARILLQEDAIARVSGAALRIGSAGTSINTRRMLQKFGDRCYDRLIAVNEQRGVHETLRNAEFVTALTGRPPTAYAFDNAHGASSDCTIAVAVGAGWAGRVWPLEKLAQLISHVRHTRPSWHIVLLGVADDRRLATKLETLVAGGVDNRVGQTALHEFVAAIAAAELVICNDSSAYHIAMALGRKVICFLGGGHFGWFAPYPDFDRKSGRAVVLSFPMECFWCNWNCKYPRAPDGAVLCVESIAVQTAIDSLESLLRS